MSDDFLVLYLVDPNTPFNDRAALLDLCRKIGLIGDAFDYFGHLHFHAGINFHRLINFIGSHTIIELEHWGDKELREVRRIDSGFVDHHLYIPEFSQEMRFWIGATEEKPTCPNCSLPITDFIDAINRWDADKTSYRWECPKCRARIPLSELDWGHFAGFARVAIEIWQIGYNEALPSTELLNTMASLTGTTWNYLYYHI